MKDPKAIRKAIMTARNIAAMIDPNFARVPLPQIGEPDPEEAMQPEQFAAGGAISGHQVLKHMNDVHHESGLNKPIEKHIVGKKWRLRQIEPHEIPDMEHDVYFNDPFNRVLDFNNDQIEHYKRKLSLGHSIPPIIKSGDAILDGNHRAQAAKELGLPIQAYVPEDETEQYAAGGEVDDHVVNNPMSVFPKPQRMFDEDMPGGAYLSMPDKADVTGHRAAQASIGIGEGGRPYFNASRDEVDETGSPGKGSALVKTNLFKQKAGWRWLNAPEGHEGTGTIVSVEHRGKHHYVMDAHFPNGVDLSRYPDAPSEPRLRPTTRGNVELGPQVGSILVRGREHPVHSHAIVREYGGRVGYADGGMPDDEQPTDYSAPDDMGLYSHAAATAASFPQAKASPEEFRNILANRGVKQSEFEASGYDQAFADQPQVTREQVAEHFHQNRTPIEEKRFYDNNPQLDALEKDYWDKLREIQARKVAHHEANPDQDNTGWGNDEKAALRDDYHKARAAVLESKDHIQSAGNTHHEGYALPGGENYREVLLKHGGDDVRFPGDDNHFGKEPNILTHLLMKDRTDTEGKRLLHLDELQSDWAQKGRQEGFSGPIDEDRFQKLNSMPDSVRTADEDAELTDMFKKLQGVSTGPYVTKTDDWVDLGLKRALLEAAKGGHDKLAWTPGDVVADRYNLSKHISNIHHEKNDDGTYNIVARNHRGATVYDQDDLAEKDVVSALGKEVAGKIFSGEGVGREEAQARIKNAQKAYEEFKDKLIGTDMQRRLEVRRQGDPNFNWDEDQEERLKEILREGTENSGIHTYAEKMGLHDEHQPLYNELRNANSAMNSSPYSPYRNWRTLSGVDLTIGGEGMKKFYDEMVPKRLMKLAKHHDPDAKFSVSTVKHPIKSSDDYYNEDRPEETTDLPTLEITPKMRESILKKGFSAYADGGEVEGYAEGGDVDPERMREYLKRIHSPLSENPASVQKALQIAQSYRTHTSGPMKLQTGTGGYYGINQPMDVADVASTIKSIPGVTPKKTQAKSWEDLFKEGKGGTLVSLGGDRSNLGRLTHINGKELAWHVDLHAGPKYMLEANKGQVWANSKEHTSAFNKIINDAAQKGPVFGVYKPMGPQSVDSAHNMFDAVMAQIPDSDISKEDARQFDEDLLSGKHFKGVEPEKAAAKAAKAMAGWPGILNAKKASEFARNLPGTHRSAIINYMDKTPMLKKGFPAIGVTRAAITDPDVKNAQGNMIGHRIARLSTDAGGVEPSFDHSTYTDPTHGEYWGDVPLVQTHYAMPQAVEQMIAQPTKAGQVIHPYSEEAKGRDSARGLFNFYKRQEPINQRMLDSVMTGMENQDKYGFKKGGKVRSALMIAKGLKKR